jgi:hypothetical protein
MRAGENTEQTEITEQTEKPQRTFPSVPVIPFVPYSQSHLGYASMDSPAGSETPALPSSLFATTLG